MKKMNNNSSFSISNSVNIFFKDKRELQDTINSCQLKARKIESIIPCNNKDCVRMVLCKAGNNTCTLPV